MFRKVLVVAELALAFVLVMGAGLLGRSFLRLTGVNPGYDHAQRAHHGRLCLRPTLRRARTSSNFYQQVKQRLLAMPGVESIGMTSTLLLGGRDRRSVHIQERPVANPADAPAADTYSVSPDYFRVLRIPLKRGRLFTDADREGAPDVALISESCARALFRDVDPLTQHVEFGGRDNRHWASIVGVVGDVRQRGLDEPSNMEVYLSQAQNVYFAYTMLIRTTGVPTHYENAARAVYGDGSDSAHFSHGFAGHLSLRHAGHAHVHARAACAVRRIGVGAGRGGYLRGVLLRCDSSRTRSRRFAMALGAGRREVLSMVLGQGVVLVAVGLAIGLGVSLVLARFLGTLLYDTGPADPVTLAAAAAGLSAIALLATYIPAQRGH